MAGSPMLSSSLLASSRRANDLSPSWVTSVAMGVPSALPWVSAGNEFPSNVRIRPATMAKRLKYRMRPSRG